MNASILSLFIPVLTIFIVINGSLWLIEDILYCVVPYSAITISILLLGVYLLRIPAPDPTDVIEIIGKDPGIIREDSKAVVKVIAHRGACLDAPENSLAAFKLCSDKGCDFIEFDVTLTSDGVPIVFHDKTLQRITGSDLVVHNTTWEELSKVDISVRHPSRNRFSDVRIPTLDEAVTQLLAYGQKMIIDIKDNDTKMVPVILNLYKRYPELKSKSIVSSFYPIIIYLIRRGNSNIACSLAWKRHEFAYEDVDGCCRRSNLWYRHYFLEFCDYLHSWALPRITYYVLGLSVVLLHKESLSGEDVINWRNRGVRVMTWTVNTPIKKQFLGRVLKVTYLTDTLDESSNSLSVG